MKWAGPIFSAFGVGAGIVLSEYVLEPRPFAYLGRPLLAVLVLAILIGTASLPTAGVAGLTATSAMAWILLPDSVVAVVTLGTLGMAIAFRLWKGRVLDVGLPVAVASAVFMAVGLIPALSAYGGGVDQPAWSERDIEAADAGRSMYLILLDSYPRRDSLEHVGIDIGPFITELERRGFDHYPNATSHHITTFGTITYLTTGRPYEGPTWISSPDRADVRASWELPPGFVAVAPPFGSVTIPGIATLNPGGPTDLEARLIRRSLFGSLLGEYVMDGLRFQLERGLQTLRATKNRRVWAHLLAPHPPFLYDGSGPAAVPECWPECGTFDFDAERLALGVEGWAKGMESYLEWLNPRLIEAVDDIIERDPEADIVLFSDHGGRYSQSEPEEWHKVLLLARTPSRPGIFEASPHPESLLGVLVGSP